MINYNNHNITAITYDNHNIKYVYGCSGNLVWSGNTTPPTPHDYSKDALGFVAKEDVFFTFHYALTPTQLYFSTNNGSTWTQLDNVNVDRTPVIHAGEKIMWKGQLTPSTASQDYGIGRFISYNGNNDNYKGRFDVEGNVMSLLFGDNFSGQTSLIGYNEAFINLFSGLTELESAENMILPATTLSYRCYGQMFRACVSLTTAPTLPATVLAERCYASMFNDCTSLNKITCLAEDISAPNCTVLWVSDVAANGTFIKSPNMQSWTTGADGIPSGWTIQ